MRMDTICLTVGGVAMAVMCSCSRHLPTVHNSTSEGLTFTLVSPTELYSSKNSVSEQFSHFIPAGDSWTPKRSDVRARRLDLKYDRGGFVLTVTDGVAERSYLLNSSRVSACTVSNKPNSDGYHVEYADEFKQSNVAMHIESDDL